MKARGESIARRYEIIVALLSVGVGLICATVATNTAAVRVSEEFYATIAQVLAVFLVALAIQQRLVDRVGMSQEEYVRRAGQSHELAVAASIAWEDERPEEGRRLETLFESQPEFAWVGELAMDFVYQGDPDDLPDIELLAQGRYRDRRRGEAVFLITAIGLLVLGEAGALGGLLHGGTPRCSPWLWITVTSAVGTFLAITLGGARELVASLRG